ncbi:hypothetical protein AVEN_75948-1 [Araneus ventricosus]|uniref:RING-type domain-containing protein n=1 Tax=Araneus ventricosus TaxID=182803 RepID=A0A4Y2M393_ARAVE|nr:hypothetical protein AVEN_75948-1 [Araneus ventricosus]
MKAITRKQTEQHINQRDSSEIQARSASTRNKHSKKKRKITTAQAETFSRVEAEIRICEICCELIDNAAFVRLHCGHYEHKRCLQIEAIRKLPCYGCVSRREFRLRPWLGWIRVHVGHLGNEKADEPSKEAIASTETAVLSFPLPRSNAKQDLKQRALAKWQRRWDDGINGRSTYEIIKKVGLRNHNWPRQLIQFITGRLPFPSYLFRFGKHPHNCCVCGEPGTHFHYTIKYRLTLFVRPQVSSISTHRSLDEINNQPPPASKQNNRPPQLYHQPRRPT